MRTIGHKINSMDWHKESGGLSRAINENLCQLIVMTERQYGRTSWEAKIVKSLSDIFREWRNQLDNNFYRENPANDGGSPYFGTKFRRGLQ